MTLHTAWDLLGSVLRRFKVGSVHPRGSCFLLGRALLVSELHCTCLLDFIFLIGSVKMPVREEAVKILKQCKKNPETLVSHVLKHQCLKYDLWEGSLPSCFVPGANFISHKSNEVPGLFSEGSFKMQTSYRSQVQVLPCVLLSCQFSALFLIRF